MKLVQSNATLFWSAKRIFILKISQADNETAVYKKKKDKTNKVPAEQVYYLLNCKTLIKFLVNEMSARHNGKFK